MKCGERCGQLSGVTRTKERGRDRKLVKDSSNRDRTVRCPVCMRGALLGRQQRQQGRQGIQRKRLSCWKFEIISAQRERISGGVAAHHRAIGRHDFNAEIS